MALTLCVFTESKAQRPGTASDCRRGGRHCCDSVLLSQKRDGNYMVCKYLVKHDRNNDFAVRYRINLSTMSPTSDGNGSELAALNAFMDSLARDTTMHIHSVTITGYASPDGVESSNLRLANARAVNFKNYLDNRYGLSKKYKVNIEAVVDDWDSCLAALDRSKIEDSERAAAIIRSRESRADKQRSLKSMPKVWNYLAADVLPPLRQADIEFYYGQDGIAETRTRVAETRPAETTAVAQKPRQHENRCCCCCGEVITSNVTCVEDMTNGLIVEMDDVDVDFY